MKRIIFSVLKNSMLQEAYIENKIDQGNSKKLKKGKRSLKVPWTKDEDELLLSLTRKNSRNKWSEIANFFTNKSPALCQLRYLKINPMIKKGRWNTEEDIKLLNLINDYGFSWTFISKFFKNRNAKQIRSRYINNLSKSKISEDKNSEYTISTISDCDDFKGKFFDSSLSEKLNLNPINININFNTSGYNNNIQFNSFDIGCFFNNEGNSYIEQTL